MARRLAGLYVCDISRGNRKEERRATPKLALHPDPAAVRADNSFRDGETQACPLVLCLAAAPVALEEMRYIFFANPRTVIGDCKQQLVPSCLDSEGDVPALSRGLGRVTDQVGEDLKNAIAVAVGP